MLRKTCGIMPFTEAGIAELPTADPTGIERRLKYRTCLQNTNTCRSI